MAAKYIKIFFDFDDSTAALTDAEIGRLVKGMLQYARDGKKPVFRGKEDVIFPVFKAQIDREKESYSEKSKALSENGKKGGRPKKAKKSNCFSEKANESKKSQEEEKEEEYITTTTTDNTHTTACARGISGGNSEAVENPVENTEEDLPGDPPMHPPDSLLVYKYFHDVLGMSDASTECEVFVAYNAKRGWDCLPNWKAAADLWDARKRKKER